MSLSSKNKKITILAAATVAVGALLIPVSGADFSASDTGTITAQAGTLTLDLTDGANQGTFNLNFPNLAPGTSQTKSFWVTNTGSIPADASFVLDGGVQFGPQLQTKTDASLLKITVNGETKPAPQYATGSISLGEVGPGQTIKVDVGFALDQTAGNSWQGVTAGATAKVTLNQK